VLWIAFNLWFDDLWHTGVPLIIVPPAVVNCFQFVIWRSLTHLAAYFFMISPSCELLSICDLTIFDTPHRRGNRQWDNVVNCFQFVIWRSLTHLAWIPLWLTICCELLSICDLTIFDTPVATNSTFTTLLWIAFNLWFDDLWHTLDGKCIHRSVVVNCFQFVIWRSLTHHRCSRIVPNRCCELLSICDLTIFDTPPLFYY